MRRSSRPTALSLTALAVGLLTSLLPVTAAQAAGTASVSGTVRAEAGGALRGIAVSLYAYDPQYDEWDTVAETTTLGDGNYSFTGVDAGSYRIGFHDTVAEYVSEYYDDADALEHSTPVGVAPGAHVGGKDAALTRGGTITGTVSGSGGAVLDDVAVEVYSETDDGQGGTYWRIVGEAETGTGGTYEVRGLRTGSYRLGFIDVGDGHLAEYWNDAASVETADDVTATAGAATRNVDVELQRGAEITGLVTGVGGAPVEDVDVSAYRWDAAEAYWEYVSDDITAANGSYRIDGLPTGEYRLEFVDYLGRGYAREYWDNATTVWGATPIRVSAGGAATGRNAQLEVGGVIRGAVTAPTSMDDVAAVAYQLVHGQWRFVAGDYVRSDGTYAIDSLPAGTYRLGFVDYENRLAREYWDNKPTIGLAADIVVTSGVTAGGYNAALGTVPPPAVPPPPAPVPPAPAPAPAPAPVVNVAAELEQILAGAKVGGKPVVGRTLRLRNLDASFRGTVSYKVQWYAGKKAIRKATKPTLKVTRAMTGKVISVKVKATSAGVTRTKKIKVGKVRG